MYKFDLSACVVSSAGNVRSNNEDNYRLCGSFRTDVSLNDTRESCACIDRKALFSVCDGMGGEEYGEVASLYAVRSLRSARCTDAERIAKEDVLRLDLEIGEEAARRGGSRMGSTLANLYIDHGKALCCNLGDSRIYLHRDCVLTKLSVDHDEATRLVSMGLLSLEEARTDKRRHHLTQYLGMSFDEVLPEPYIAKELTLADGDRFLLCSDGVTDMLTDGEISAVLIENETAEDAADALIDAVLSGKGKDNATALIVDVRKRPVLSYILF